jgi:hypothetical protein
MWEHSPLARTLKKVPERKAEFTTSIADRRIAHADQRQLENSMGICDIARNRQADLANRI